MHTNILSIKQQELLKFISVISFLIEKSLEN